MIRGSFLRNAFIKTLIITFWFNISQLSGQTNEGILLDGAWLNDIDMVRTALLNGADANTRHSDGATALHYACMNENFQMVHVLISAGADPSVADDKLNTPLHVCASNGNDTIAEYLILNNAPIDAKNSNDITPLMLAVQNGYYVFSDMCLYYGASIHHRSADSTGLVHQAVLAQNHELLKLLISRGAEVSKCNQSGYTPLLFAALNNDTTSMSILLHAGASPAYQCNMAYSPDLLSMVIQRGNTDVMSYLLMKKLVRKDSMMRYRDEAIRLNDYPMRKVLRNYGVPISIRPILHGITLGHLWLLNFKDHFCGFNMFTEELKTGLGFSMGFATRLWNKNVLYLDGSTSTLFQLKERRTILFFGQEKSFGLVNARRNSLRVSLGVEEQYTWAKWEGVVFDPFKGWMIAPKADFIWRTPQSRLSIGVRWIDFESNLPRLYFSLGGGLTIPYNN